MPWGVELWDRLDRINQYTEDGLGFVDKTRNFFIQLSQVELEYSKNLRKVIKANQSPDSDNSTLNQAWKQIMTSLDDVAGYHEKAAGTLNTEINSTLQNLIKTKRAERMEINKNIAKLQAELNGAYENLEKTRRKHEKVFREAEAAKSAYDKMDRRDDVAKAKQEKARKLWAEKAKASDASEKVLRQVTDETNGTRTMHFYTQMPEQFNLLQALNENRAEGLASVFNQVASVLRDELSYDLHAVTAFDDAAKKHNKSEDSALFAQLNKSGEPLPKDLPVPLPTAGTGSPKLARAGGSPKTSHRDSSHQGGGGYEEDEDEESSARASQASVQGYAGRPQCRALYGFAGSNPGELPVGENEILGVVQNDGSGWVLAEKLSTRQQGYVPESYLQML